MKKVNLKVVLAAAAALAVLTVGGIYAYLTFTQSVTNTFTVGNVSAELTEPNWDEGATAGDNQNIYPCQKLAKDPTITIGSGSNDAIVFMEVTYPVQEVVTISDAGAKNDAADTQLFTPGDLGDGWVELESKKSEADGSVTKVYGYNTELAAGDSSTLFEEVTFANVAEDQIVDSLDIVVKADVIQAGSMDKEGDTFTVEELSVIYDKFAAQNAAAE